MTLTNQVRGFFGVALIGFGAIAWFKGVSVHPVVSTSFGLFLLFSAIRKDGAS